MSAAIIPGSAGLTHTPELSLADYIERNATVLELCAGKSVLHLGCVGFTDCPVEEKVELAHASLHAALSHVSQCIGVDIDETTVRQLQERAVFDNILVGDVEELDRLPKLGQFDFVVAGDIIEHLSNPGRMLDGAKPYLKPDGVLVVSTPNSFGLPSYLRMLAGRHEEGKQHVLSFNIVTLRQLLERHGYEIVRARACYQKSAGSNSLFPILSKLFRRFPKLGGTLLFECRVAR